MVSSERLKWFAMKLLELIFWFVSSSFWSVSSSS